MDERNSRVIDLRFFGGLSVDETAVALKVFSFERNGEREEIERLAIERHRSYSSHSQLVATEGPTEEESERGGNRERQPGIALHERLDVRHHALGIVSAHVLGAAAQAVGGRPRNIANGFATWQVGSPVMKR